MKNTIIIIVLLELLFGQIIEKQNKVTNYDVFTVKLDCSNMNEGTDSWYENNSSSSGDGDPYDEEGDNTLSSTEPLIYRDRWQDTALSDMFNYDNLFSDELDVSDNAVSMAINNATTKDSEGNAVEYILDDNVGNSELEDMLAKAKEDGTQEEISFLQNQLSGLSSTQGSSEGKKTSSSSSNLDLFSNQEKSKDFSLKEPPAKLKDARVGIKDFRKLLKDFKWNSKMVSRKTSRPKQ